jgi:hypothetical protein
MLDFHCLHRDKSNAAIINSQKRLSIVPIAVLPLALSMAVAQARGVGITHQSLAQKSAPAAREAAAPAAKPSMPVQAEPEIVAERLPIQVPASEAESLLGALRVQLATQPDAKLSIRWRLTRPAGVK